MPNPAQPDADIVAGHFSQTNQGEAKHVTSKDSGEIDSSFLKTIATLPIAENMDGSSVPKAVFINEAGNVVLSDASKSTTADFLGFVKESVTGATPTNYIDSFSGVISVANVTIKAGEKKVIAVTFGAAGFNATSAPSSMTWNSVSLTQAGFFTGDESHVSIWYAVLGDVAVDTTSTLSVVGTPFPGSNYGPSVVAYDLGGVDQTNPVYSDSYAEIAELSSATLPVSTLANAISIGVVSVESNEPIVFDNSFTVVHSALTTSGASYRQVHGYEDNLVLGTKNYTSSIGATGNTASFGVAVFKPDPTTVLGEVHIEKINTDFSGLTAGQPYYLSNTAGEISTVAGSNKKKIGNAISSSEIYLLR